GNQLDVVGVGVGADRRRPVAGGAVLGPVDPESPRIGEPDLAHEGQGRVAVAARPGPDAQIVSVHAERTDEVADPLPARVGRTMPLGAAAVSPAASMTGAETLRPLLVEADHDAVSRLLPVEGEHPCRLRGVVAVGALL